MDTEIIGARYRVTTNDDKAILEDILNEIAEGFNKNMAIGFSGIFQLSIKCNNVFIDHFIQVKDEIMTLVLNEIAPDYYLKISCDLETFCNITLGKFNPVIDVSTGLIRLDKGLWSLNRFAKFGKLLSRRDIATKLPTKIEHPKTWVKPGKILLVNGSPRRNGSTKVMLEWFMAGLPAEKTEVLDVSSLKIGKCLHCFKCWTDNPNDCVINDDASIFRQKIDDADLIVFFVPLSYSSMPSDMKRAMERLMPETTPFFYHNTEFGGTAHPLHKHKKSQAFLQFLVWGFPEMKHGDVLENNFNDWAAHSHKVNLGSIKRPGVNMILGDPRLHFERQNIKKAVSSIASSVYNFGLVPRKEKSVVESMKYYKIKDFHFYATNYWIKKFKTDYWGK